MNYHAIVLDIIEAVGGERALWDSEYGRAQVDKAADILKKAVGQFGHPHPSHQWSGGILNQCVKCEAFHGQLGGMLPCDPTKLEGKTEPCCECGEDYPRSDLIAGHIYCSRCR